MRSFILDGGLVALTLFMGGCSSASGNSPDEGAPAAGGTSAGTAGATAAGGVATSSGGSATAGSVNASGGSAGSAGNSSGGMNGTAGSGGSGGSAGGNHVVTNCDALGPVGTWEEITPPEIDLTSSITPYATSNFGTAALRLNPQNTAQVYLGTEAWGFFGSTDCGANFTKLNTGLNAEAMDHGNQWTLAVDPEDPETLYSNSGFYLNGVLKSTNGGVDWDNVLTESNVTGDLPFSVIPYGGFVGTFSVDPESHLHIVSSFHSSCNPPAESMCYIETADGGATWTVRNITIPDIGGGEHTLIEFLTSTRWLFGTQDGVFISDNSGADWTKIPGEHGIVHHQQTYRTADGHFFQSTWQGLMYSTTGAYDDWTMVPGAPAAAVGVAGDGTHVWTSMAGPWAGPCDATDSRYWQGSETDPAAGVTKMEGAPLMGDGALFMAYDTDHHILYSSNFCGGAWRVVTE